MDAAATLALLLDRVVDGADSRPDAETTGAILEEAARFAEGRLAPLAPVAAREGCRMVDGRVRTAPGRAETWRAFGEAGWAGLAAGEAAGGQGLPLALAAAAQELFDAADPGFGMLAINARCATRLLERHGDRGVATGAERHGERLGREAEARHDDLVLARRKPQHRDAPRIRERADAAAAHGRALDGGRLVADRHGERGGGVLGAIGGRARQERQEGRERVCEVVGGGSHRGKDSGAAAVMAARAPPRHLHDSPDRDRPCAPAATPRPPC